MTYGTDPFGTLAYGEAAAAESGVDTEAKRWSMLAFANNPVHSHLFNPDTSGLVSIEKITTLDYYGGNAWAAPVGGAAHPHNVFGQVFRGASGGPF